MKVRVHYIPHQEFEKYPMIDYRDKDKLTRFYKENDFKFKYCLPANDATIVVYGNKEKESVLIRWNSWAETEGDIKEYDKQKHGM